MYSFIFTENALSDVITHAVNYEEKQEGLGARFMDEVDNTALEISKIPTAYINAYKTTRERKTKFFPFKLIYTREDNIVFIHAVYPCKANPSKKYNHIL